MNRWVCYIEPDLSQARVVSDTADETWRAAAEPENGDEGSAIAAQRARQRIADAAAWVAGQITPSHRIETVCIGVSRSLCGPLAAPSADEQVVTAAVRMREQDWGQADAPGTIQPLAVRQSKAKQSPWSVRVPRLGRGGASSTALAPLAKRMRPVAVLRIQDGAVRMFLDELDRRGVRIGAVLTLWHGAARAWAGGDAAATADNGHPGPGSDLLTAVAMLEPSGSVIWAWCDGDRLVAAGLAAIPGAGAAPGAGPGEQASAPASAESFSGRLILDWMTWSAQLGRTPDRIALIGRRGATLAKRLETAWPAAAPVRLIEEGDPIGATMKRLVHSSPDIEEAAEDPRQSVLDLTTRPGRAHKRLITWSAVAAMLVALGVGVIGIRMLTWAGDVRDLAALKRTELREVVRGVAPGLDTHAAPALALQGELMRLVNEGRSDVRRPPPPDPVLDELMIVAQELAKLENTNAQVQRFQVSREATNISVSLRELGAAEALRNALAQSGGKIRWTGRIEGTPPNVMLYLTGEWRLTP